MESFIEKISHFFATNRPLSQLLLVSIVALGVVAFLVMPKQYNPEIVRPAFVIHFSYDGATTVAARGKMGYELTEALRVLPKIEDINTTIKDGASITSTVIFAVGADKAKVKSDLLTVLAGVEAKAGQAISNLQVQEINPETIPVLQIVFSSPSKTVSEVRELVKSLEPALLAVSGVSGLTTVGGEGRGILVEVDPSTLAAAEVRLATLQNTLQSSQERVVTLGIEGGRYRINATYDAQADTITELGLLPLSSTVRVRDVATIYEGLLPTRSYTLYADKETNAAEVVILAVAKQEGTSAPIVTKAVRERIEQLLTTTNQYQVLTYQVVSDDGIVASDEIMGLTKNLLTSIGIVALVLLLFLSARAALVVLVTIPLTFLSVLGVGLLFDESINRITLFALILSLGLLVDASIVVVDTMYDALRVAHARGRTENLPALAASAVKEVGVGLILSAITSVIVFLPMNYITGMMGPYMGPIAFFVPVALIISLIVAIVLTPFIAIQLLKGEEKELALAQYFKRQLSRLTERYIQVLKKIAYNTKVRHGVLAGAMGAFLVALILPIAGLVHFQMLPKADRDQVYVYIDLPQGTAREVTRQFTETVAALALTHEEVRTTQLFVAGAPVPDFNGLFKGAPQRRAPEQATIRLNLTKAVDRPDSSTTITNELRATFVAKLAEDVAYVRLMEEPPGPPVLATLVAKFSADDLVRQQQAAEQFAAYIAAVPGVVDTYTSVEAAVEELTYTLDREKTLAAGLMTQEVSSWFALTTSPQEISEFVSAKSRELVPIALTVPTEYQYSPLAVGSLPVAGHPLASLLTTSYTTRPSATYLEGAIPVEYVTAEVEGRSIVYVVIEIMRGLIRGDWSGYRVDSWNLFGLTLLATDGSTIDLSWGGEWEMTLENFRDLGLAMLVALFLVYAVLVAQYRSFAVPGFILVTVPLGLVGIFMGFLFLDSLFGIYLTATALIGFIALIGIVVNNAIIYLEYVEQSLAEGVMYTEALIAAGAMRLRPILLTSLTTVLGSLTIASDPVWSGLAWAIIFGLSLSTILTLVIFPSLLITFARDRVT